MQKYQLNFLELVYPPVSNQEAEWLKEDEEVQKAISASNIYMICQRVESYFKFNDNPIDQEKKELAFTYSQGSSTSEVIIDLVELESYHCADLDDVLIELGPKIIRISKHDEIIDWFTTEKLLFDRWRGKCFIKGLDDYRMFAEYYLHYVGISKKEDSLSRLVVKPHDKRIRILSNEYPFSSHSRTTDEMTLLFFKISPFHIKVADQSTNMDRFAYEVINQVMPSKISIISDAEKAFVKIMGSEYNIVKYENYPRCSDGLYNEGLIRYGYLISEGLSLRTKTRSIKGEFFKTDLTRMNFADMIFIHDGLVELIVKE